MSAVSKPKLKIPVAKLGIFYREDKNSPLGYSAVKFTQTDFDYLKEHPAARGYEPMLRRGHNEKGQGIQDGETADGHLLQYVQEDDVLFGEFEANNDKVVEEINNGEFRYASGEFVRNSLSKLNPSVRIPITVKAVGLTNTPFLPDLPRATVINCSEGSSTDSFFQLNYVPEDEVQLLSDLRDQINVLEESSVKTSETPVVPANAETTQNLADLSLDDVRAAISKAFRESLGLGDSCCGVYIRDIYLAAKYVVACKYEDGEPAYYKYDFTESDGSYDFAEPKRCVMQYEVVENLSDDLLPGRANPQIREIRGLKKIVMDFMASFKKPEVTESLSEAATVPETAPEASEASAPVVEEPKSETVENAETPAEVPATEVPEGEGQPVVEGEPQEDSAGTPSVQPNEENETMEFTPEQIAEYEELKQMKAALELEKQNLSDRAFESQLDAFKNEAAKFVTPEAAGMFADIIKANRNSVEKFSLSEGTEEISLSDAILNAVKLAVPTAETQEILGEQVGAQNLSDQEESASGLGMWASRIESIKK